MVSLINKPFIKLLLALLCISSIQCSVMYKNCSNDSDCSDGMQCIDYGDGAKACRLPLRECNVGDTRPCSEGCQITQETCLKNGRWSGCFTGEYSCPKGFMMSKKAAEEAGATQLQRGDLYCNACSAHDLLSETGEFSLDNFEQCCDLNAAFFPPVCCSVGHIYDNNKTEMINYCKNVYKIDASNMLETNTCLLADQYDTADPCYKNLSVPVQDYIKNISGSECDSIYQCNENTIEKCANEGIFYKGESCSLKALFACKGISPSIISKTTPRNLLPGDETDLATCLKELLQHYTTDYTDLCPTDSTKISNFDKEVCVERIIKLKDKLEENCANLGATCTKSENTQSKTTYDECTWKKDENNNVLCEGDKLQDCYNDLNGYNCDIRTSQDNHFLGEPCSNGQGLCKETGYMMCTAEGLACSAKSATAPDPAKSGLCDNLDNNCDGVIDDFALSQNLTPTPTEYAPATSTPPISYAATTFILDNKKYIAAFYSTTYECKGEASDNPCAVLQGVPSVYKTARGQASDTANALTLAVFSQDLTAKLASSPTINGIVKVPGSIGDTPNDSIPVNTSVQNPQIVYFEKPSNSGTESFIAVFYTKSAPPKDLDAPEELLATPRITVKALDFNEVFYRIYQVQIKVDGSIELSPKKLCLNSAKMVCPSTNDPNNSEACISCIEELSTPRNAYGPVSSYHAELLQPTPTCRSTDMTSCPPQIFVQYLRQKDIKVSEVDYADAKMFSLRLDLNTLASAYVGYGEQKGLTSQTTLAHGYFINPTVEKVTDIEPDWTKAIPNSSVLLASTGLLNSQIGYALTLNQSFSESASLKLSLFSIYNYTHRTYRKGSVYLFNYSDASETINESEKVIQTITLPLKSADSPEQGYAIPPGFVMASKSIPIEAAASFGAKSALILSLYKESAEALPKLILSQIHLNNLASTIVSSETRDLLLNDETNDALFTKMTAANIAWIGPQNAILFFEAEAKSYAVPLRIDLNRLYSESALSFTAPVLLNCANIQSVSRANNLFIANLNAKIALYSLSCDNASSLQEPILP